MAIWEISGSMESLGSDSEEDGCEVYDLWGHGLQDTYRESAARESASRESPGVVITTRNDGFYHYSPDSSPIATGSHTCYMFSEGDLDDYFPERFQVGRRNKTCVSLSSECRGGEMDTKSTTMDFGIHFETGNLGLPETFFSVEDMLNYSNEDIAGPIGEGESLVSGENVSNMGTSNTAGELNSKFSDIDLQRAGELNSGHSGNAQGVEQLKADLSFDVHRDIITHEFPAIDPLSVPYDDNDWLSTLNLNLLDGPFPCEEKAGYGEDFFGMHGETSMTCNQSSITSDQKSFRGNDKSITGTQRSYRDPFVSSSPVSVLESTSVSSSNTRGDGNCAINVEHTNINHGDQSHHNQLYKEQSVPGRARSKRLRTTGHMWGNARILADASSVSSTNPATATDAETTFSSDSSLFSDSQGVPGGGGAGAGGGNVKLKRECLNSTYSVPPADDMQNISHMLGMMTPPPKAVTTTKKPSKPGKNSSSSSKDGAASASSAETSNQQQPWRCLHCGSQRTPQWRAGPKGPKTLCNACGVRFKSGRLVDEYRPAGSPGFDSNKHSNCHKKILERRRQSSSQPIPVPLKTTFKNEPMPYHPLGLPTGVEFQSIGTYAPPHPFSSSPRGLDVDRTSCS